eukprot:TRINITY_DN4532_c0_g1_i1.p1 TRINITY_DN4532_c0_g1~~TRINITY_DN4532_c0_g1_i1.p1  ORF type:complete len:637 (+),score=88.06 TRINITY_DN4532_c0_g1_i1:183-2093(+)
MNTIAKNYSVCYFDFLPAELIFHILGHLQVKDFAQCSQLSQAWNHFCKQPIHWKTLCNRTYGCNLSQFADLVNDPKWDWKDHFVQVHTCFSLHKKGQLKCSFHEMLNGPSFLPEHKYFRYSCFTYSLLALERCSIHSTKFVKDGWVSDSDDGERKAWLSQTTENPLRLIRASGEDKWERNVTDILADCLSDLQRIYEEPAWINPSSVFPWKSKHGKGPELSASIMQSIQRGIGTVPEGNTWSGGITPSDAKLYRDAPLTLACTGLLDLEMNIRWEAVTEEWRQIRDPWRAGLKLLKILYRPTAPPLPPVPTFSMVRSPQPKQKKIKTQNIEIVSEAPPSKFLNERVHWTKYQSVLPLDPVPWGVWGWIWPSNMPHLLKRQERRSKDESLRDSVKTLIRSLEEMELNLQWKSLSPKWRILKNQKWMKTVRSIVTEMNQEWYKVKDTILPMEETLDQIICEIEKKKKENILAQLADTDFEDTEGTETTENVDKLEFENETISDSQRLEETSTQLFEDWMSKSMDYVLHGEAALAQEMLDLMRHLQHTMLRDEDGGQVDARETRDWIHRLEAISIKYDPAQLDHRAKKEEVENKGREIVLSLIELHRWLTNGRAFIACDKGNWVNDWNNRLNHLLYYWS